MLRFLVYHQKKLINMNLMGEGVLPEKYLLEKAPTIKRFEYLPLGS